MKLNNHTATLKKALEGLTGVTLVFSQYITDGSGVPSFLAAGNLPKKTRLALLQLISQGAPFRFFYGDTRKWVFEILPGMPTARHPVTCVAAIIEDSGKVLIGDRVAGSIPCLPGGKVDWNETVEDALRREVEEECGLVVEISGFAGFNDDIWLDEDTHFVTLLFYCRVVGGQLQECEPHKINNFRWLSPESVPPLYAGSERFIKVPEPGVKYSERAPGTLDVDGDDFVQRCWEVIQQEKLASTSLIQRRFRVGYTRTENVMDVLEQRGFVGPKKPSYAPRDILIRRHAE